MIDISGICQNCFQETDTNEARCPHCGEPPLRVPSRSPRCLPHQTILNGRYLIGRVLGEGGFGITYLALDLVSGERVAVKEYFPVDLASREYSSMLHATLSVRTGEAEEHFRNGFRRFEREAGILRQLNDKPGIVSVRDYFPENGTAYIVMTYIEGPTLARFIKENDFPAPTRDASGREPASPMSYQEAFRLMRPVMESLRDVHKAGIIHRDIAPDNLLVSKNLGNDSSKNRLILIDFGSAKAEQASHTNRSMTVMVKHGYAPEEQYRIHGGQGPWTDIYALCATLYYMISGIVPVDAIERLIEDKLVPLRKIGVPEAFSRIIERGMNVRASERYQSVEELLADLDAAEKAEATEREAAMREAKKREAEKKAAAQIVSPDKTAAEVREKESEVKPKPRRRLWVIAALLVILAFGAVRIFMRDTSIREKTASSADREAEGEELAGSAGVAEPAESETEMTAEAAEPAEEETEVVAEPEVSEDEDTADAPEAASQDPAEAFFADEESIDTSVEQSYTAEQKAEFYTEGWQILEDLLASYDMSAEGQTAETCIRELLPSCYERCVSSESFDAGKLFHFRSEILKAARSFGKAGDYGDDGEGLSISGMIWEQFGNINSIHVSNDSLEAIKTDGSVTVADDSLDADELAGIGTWSDVISLPAGGYYSLKYALRADGSAITYGQDSWNWVPEEWTDLVEIVQGSGSPLAALRADGRVMMQIRNGDSTFVLIEDEEWHDLIHITGANELLAAVRSDGVILIADFYEYRNENPDDFGVMKEHLYRENVFLDDDEEADIIGLYRFDDFAGTAVKKLSIDETEGVVTVLLEDGSVHLIQECFENGAFYREEAVSRIESLNDIADVGTYFGKMLVLNREGTSRFISDGRYPETDAKYLSFDGLEGVADFSFNNDAAAAILEDGTVHYAGEESAPALNCSDWTDVKALRMDGFADWSAYGLRSDGTVCAAAQPEMEKKVAEWEHVIALHEDGYALCEDGRIRWLYEDTDTEWGLEEKASLDAFMEEGLIDITEQGALAGIRADGTVAVPTYVTDYATSLKGYENWTDIIDIAATDHQIMGLRSDGTVVMTEMESDDEENKDSEAAVLALTNVKKIVSADWWNQGFAVLTDEGRAYCTFKKYQDQLDGVEGIEDLFFVANALLYKDSSGWHPCYSYDNVPEIPAEFLTKDVVSLVQGEHYCIALLEDGTIRRDSLSISSREAVRDWQDLLVIRK